MRDGHGGRDVGHPRHDSGCRRRERAAARRPAVIAPAERSTPHVELTVDWGGGRAAMTASAFCGSSNPASRIRLAGLGDEASSIGPALWVRVGDDLVNLTIWGVDEDVAAAKRIIDLMRPRMGAPRKPRRRDGERDRRGRTGSERSSAASSDRLAKETAAIAAPLTRHHARHRPRRRTASPLADEAMVPVRRLARRSAFRSSPA